MPDLQWLDGYNGESVDELIALEGKYRTDSLVLAFEQAMDQKEARVGEDKLTAEEHVILAVEALEREVNNGGYEQFFLNASRAGATAGSSSSAEGSSPRPSLPSGRATPGPAKPQVVAKAGAWACSGRSCPNISMSRCSLCQLAHDVPEPRAADRTLGNQLSIVDNAEHAVVRRKLP